MRFNLIVVAATIIVSFVIIFNYKPETKPLLTIEQINKACEDYSQKSTGDKLKVKQLCIDYKLYNTSN